jgi:hypothetical protein
LDLRVNLRKGSRSICRVLANRDYRAKAKEFARLTVVAKEIRKVLAVAHQAAGLCIFTKRKHRWDAVPERDLGNSLPLSKENCV